MTGDGWRKNNWRGLCGCRREVNVFMEMHSRVPSGRSGGAGRRIWGSLPPVWAPWNTWGSSCSRPPRGRGPSPRLCSGGGDVAVAVGLSRTMGAILMTTLRCRRSSRPLSSTALLPLPLLLRRPHRCTPPSFSGLPWLSCRFSSLCSRFLPSATWIKGTRPLTREYLRQQKAEIFRNIFRAQWRLWSKPGRVLQEYLMFVRRCRRRKRYPIAIGEESGEEGETPEKGKAKSLVFVNGDRKQRGTH